MSELKYVSDYHVVEFEEFMILKNFSKRTIKTYIQIIGYSGDTDPPLPVMLTPHKDYGSKNLND